VIAHVALIFPHILSLSPVSEVADCKYGANALRDFFVGRDGAGLVEA